MNNTNQPADNIEYYYKENIHKDRPFAAAFSGTRERIEKFIAKRVAEYGKWEQGRNKDYVLEAIKPKVSTEEQTAANTKKNENIPARPDPFAEGIYYYIEDVNGPQDWKHDFSGTVEEINKEIEERKKQFGAWNVGEHYTVIKLWWHVNKSGVKEMKPFVKAMIEELEEANRSKSTTYQSALKSREQTKAAEKEREKELEAARKAEKQARKKQVQIADPVADSTKKRKGTGLGLTDSDTPPPELKKLKTVADFMKFSQESASSAEELAMTIDIQVAKAEETQQMTYGEITLHGPQPGDNFKLIPIQMEHYRNRQCVLPMAKKICDRPQAAANDKGVDPNRPFCITHINNCWSKYRDAITNNYLNKAKGAVSKSDRLANKIKTVNLALQAMFKKWKKNAEAKLPIRIPEKERIHLICKVLNDHKVEFDAVADLFIQYKELIPKALYHAALVKKSQSPTTSDDEAPSGDESDNSEYDAEKAKHDEYEKDGFVVSDNSDSAPATPMSVSEGPTVDDTNDTSKDNIAPLENEPNNNNNGDDDDDDNGDNGEQPNNQGVGVFDYFFGTY